MLLAPPLYIVGSKRKSTVAVSGVVVLFSRSNVINTSDYRNASARVSQVRRRISDFRTDLGSWLMASRRGSRDTSPARTGPWGRATPSSWPPWPRPRPRTSTTGTTGWTSCRPAARKGPTRKLWASSRTSDTPSTTGRSGGNFQFKEHFVWFTRCVFFCWRQVPGEQQQLHHSDAPGEQQQRQLGGGGCRSKMGTYWTEKKQSATSLHNQRSSLPIVDAQPQTSPGPFQQIEIEMY